MTSLAFLGLRNWRWCLGRPVKVYRRPWNCPLNYRWILRVLFWQFSRLKDCTCEGGSKKG